ncbi:MAG: hypothetical protein L3J99_06255 [Thermoplasmata archaeon]|nr:hypothetical protein [Thermoplasmata archaeon]
MPKVGARHLAGALVAGIAGGICVLILSSWYSVYGGYTILGPYQGIGSVLGFSGDMATNIGLLVDMVIPIVIAYLMVGTLAVLSRTHLRFLEFRSPVRAGTEGGVVGVIVFGVFYVPVIEHLTHYPVLSAIAKTLEFGLAEHLIFGAVIGVVLYFVGGPVTFRTGTGSDDAPGSMDSDSGSKGP